MSFTYKRSINLYHVLNLSIFAKTNKEIYTNRGKMIGANAYAEQQIFSRQKELEVLMPRLLQVGVNSATWQQMLQKYFHSIQKDIPLSGLSLNISLVYDINDDNKKVEIAKVISAAKSKTIDIKTSEDLANYCEDEKLSNRNIYTREDSAYLVANPENYEDYVLWRYLTYHGEVANSKELVGNAPKKIRFYLESEQDKKINAKKLYEAKRKVNKYRLKIEEDSALRKALCIMFNIQAKDEIDQLMTLDSIADGDPEKFLEAVSDKKIIDKSNIESMISSGVLTKYPNSGLIVDAEDKEVVIGETLDEAISFMSNPSNLVKVNAIKARHKHLINQK